MAKNNKFEIFLPQAQAFAKLMHPHVEVVIHDIKANKIVEIFNSFSKREAGDDSLLDEDTNWAQETLVTDLYEKINYDNRKLKSITSTLRDPKTGCPIGLMCMNFDISKFSELEGFIKQMTNIGDSLTESQEKALFKNDWQERINRYVQAYLEEKKISFEDLKRKKKRELVKLLHEQGAFRAKNSAQHIADVLDISRATVYKYLKETMEA